MSMSYYYENAIFFFFPNVDIQFLSYSERAATPSYPAADNDLSKHIPRNMLGSQRYLSPLCLIRHMIGYCLRQRDLIIQPYRRSHFLRSIHKESYEILIVSTRSTHGFISILWSLNQLIFHRMNQNI